MTRCSRRALLRGAALIPLAATAADGLLDEAGAANRYFSSHGTYDHHTLSYDLRLAYDPSSGTLDGHAHIRAVADRPLARVELDLARLTAHTARVNGIPARPGQKGDKLYLTGS